MAPEVALQQPRPGESFATKLALVVEVVGQDVHGEGGHADVHLAADVTLLGVGRVQAAVSLSVSAQVTAGRVMLPTVSARVLGLLNLVQSLLTPAVCYRELAVGATGVGAVVVVVVYVRRVVVVEEGLHWGGGVGKADGGGGGGQWVTRVRDRRGQRHVVTRLGACNRCHECHDVSRSVLPGGVVM